MGTELPTTSGCSVLGSSDISTVLVIAGVLQLEKIDTPKFSNPRKCAVGVALDTPGGHPVVKYRGCVHLMWRNEVLFTTINSTVNPKIQTRPWIAFIWLRSTFRFKATKTKQIIHLHAPMMHHLRTVHCHCLIWRWAWGQRRMEKWGSYFYFVPHYFHLTNNIK